MASAERHPVRGARLASPERAERRDARATAVRDTNLTALRAIGIPPADAQPVAAVGAGDGRLILVDLSVAVVVEAVAYLVSRRHAGDAIERRVRRVFDRKVGRHVRRGV